MLLFQNKGLFIIKKNQKNINHELIEGVVYGHRDGHGFIVRADGGADVYVPAHVMCTVWHQDTVKGYISGVDRKGRPEAQITEIISRNDSSIIGRLLQENGVWLVAPEDKRYSQDILIPENALANAQSGQVVCVELVEEATLHSQPVGRIVEVLGQIDDPGMEIEIAVRKYGVPHIFPPEVITQTNKLPDRVNAADKRGRVDLTDIPFVTIDGEDSRDFDDAVYCEPIQIGRVQGYRLLVAIADVSHYVKPGTDLDNEAYNRATSVYFPRRVIPMLPEKLSNGLCSLNPDVERLCLVCDMVITPQGKTKAYQFYTAVMKSHGRLTYTEVAAILTNTHGLEAQRRSERVQDLLHLYEAYQILYKAREKRGAIDMDTVETRIVCDDLGQIERIEPYVRTDAHRLIEEAMLAANVCAAEFVEHAKRVCLYRVHEGPTPEKKEVLQQYLNANGINVALSEEPTPQEFQKIAQMARARPDASQVQMMLLRSMQQAIYTPINSGHFGLAYPAYTHFTSPIRRYPDLLLHRVIKGILSGSPYLLDNRSAVSNLEQKRGKRQEAVKPTLASAVQVKTKKTSLVSAQEMEHWIVAGLHSSANERRADEASRDVLAWLKCMYIREHLGEVFAGAVSAVTSFGLFVQLDTMYVEGLVHISELGGDYYRFDEQRQELVGERTGVRYALGSRVQVQVSRVDLDGRRIDFRFVPNERVSQNAPSVQKKLSRKSITPTKKNAVVKANAFQAGGDAVLDDFKKAVKRATRNAVKAAKNRRPKNKYK